MNITDFSFSDDRHQWYLKNASFGPLNLLVGMSGVGKTRILEAIRAVRNAGIRPITEAVNGCSWTLEFDSEDTHYSWSAKISNTKRVIPPVTPANDEDNEDASTPIFLEETIHSSRDGVLVKRQGELFEFNGSRLPRLKNTESAINLLRDEELMGPLHRALHRLIFSETPEAPGRTLLISPPTKRRQLRFDSLNVLRETSLPVSVKAYVLQESFPEEFQRVKMEYCAIFPTVSDIRIASLSELDPSAAEDAPEFFREHLTVGVKENGVDEWITGSRLSAGMYRILIHLWELSLAPAGAVVVIDEFENSLGVNCLPELTDRLQERSRDLQFIITSHHPYIINNIPSSSWRIVTRNGSTVTVLDADAIPALHEGSAQEKFIRLLNIPEYEYGILSAVG